MEEFDSHTEHASEQITEGAEASRERWVSAAALTAAILAALAAVTSLLSGHHEHEAMLGQLRASDQWAYYQANGIKAGQVEERLEVLSDRDAATTQKLRDKLAKYRARRARVRTTAEDLQRGAEGHDEQHFYLAGGVTFFQVAIAVVAIAVLSRRKLMWYGGIVLGGVAVACLVCGLLPHKPAEGAAEANVAGAGAD